MKTSHLDLVQVNSSLVLKTNWLDTQLAETVDVVVTFQKTTKQKTFAGKEAKFVTTIHEVKQKVPALTMNRKKTSTKKGKLDDLKEKYRKELTAAKEEAYKDAVEGAAPIKL